jgi:hypothetical protein
MPDSTLSTLANIRTKVRRLTRSPSTAQLSDDDIDNYVNNFVLYDFPEHLRLFSLRTVFTFFCEPYIDTYVPNLTDQTSPLYNFANIYTSFADPVYIAGYQQFFTQSREQFYGIYPQVNSIASIGPVGDGVRTAFTGTLGFNFGPTSTTTSGQVPVLANNVLFSSVDINNNGAYLSDNGNGFLVGTGIGTIDYVTGVYTLAFTTPPAVGAAINSQTIPYVPSLPQALLYYDDTITLRPVPDQPYRVTMEAYIRPAEMLNSTDEPKLSQWWQYIAYGCAKKVFEDRMDLDSVALIAPEYKKQELLVQRASIVQYTNERVATIYTEQVSGITSGGFGFGGSGLV